MVYDDAVCRAGQAGPVRSDIRNASLCSGLDGVRDPVFPFAVPDTNTIISSAIVGMIMTLTTTILTVDCLYDYHHCSWYYFH